MNALVDHLQKEQNYYTAIAVSILDDTDKADQTLARLMVRLGQLRPEEVQNFVARGEVRNFVEREVRFASKNYMNALARYLHRQSAHFAKIATAILRDETSGEDVVSTVLEQFVGMAEANVLKITQGQNAMQSFVKTTVVNRSLDELKKRKVRDIDTSVTDAETRIKRESKRINMAIELHPENGPMAEASDRALKCAECAPLCLAQLKKNSPIQWEVTHLNLTLLEKNGCEPKITELMALTGFSAAKVSSSLFNGKKALRKCISTRSGIDILKK